MTSAIPSDTGRPQHLALWDVDHTLIETGGTGREFFAEAFARVTGMPMQAMADIHGRTEPAIMRDTLALHNIAPEGDVPEAFADALAEAYEQGEARLRDRGRALPGARDALRALADRDEVVSSVLTGNLRRVTITKLSAFGLAEYVDLDVGAYGSDHDERPALVDIALRRASAAYGTTFTPGATTLIGDTPGDVAAALSAGTHILGIASGHFSTNDLEAAGAQSVLPDLTDLNGVLADIGAAPTHEGGPRRM